MTIFTAPDPQTLEVLMRIAAGADARGSFSLFTAFQLRQALELCGAKGISRCPKASLIGHAVAAAGNLLDSVDDARGNAQAILERVAPHRARVAALQRDREQGVIEAIVENTLDDLEGLPCPTGQGWARQTNRWRVRASLDRDVAVELDAQARRLGLSPAALASRILSLHVQAAR